MDYSKIYNDLIEDAILHPKPDEYKEIHHILPVCLGGDNSKNNLVKLTARQHFIAHWLLYKIHKTGELAYAWSMMSVIDENQTQRKVNSRYFKYCREARSKHLKDDLKGSGNPFYGKKHTDETKKILSEKCGRPLSDEQKKRFTEYAKLPKTEEHKKKIGRKGLVMLKNNITHETIRVNKEEARGLDPNIWRNPCKIDGYKCPTKHCVWCNRDIATSSYSQFHGDNCKMKPENFVPEKKTCPHCKRECKHQQYGRSHGDNCKMHPDRIEIYNEEQAYKKEKIPCSNCGKMVMRSRYKIKHGENCSYRKDEFKNEN